MTKKIALILLLAFIAACAPQVEIAPPPPEVKIERPPPPVIKPEPPPKQYRSGLTCREDTPEVFNQSGVEVLPFVRLAFYDIDQDGEQEIIAGAKDGTLRLYRRAPGKDGSWVHQAGYFDGIKAGAFSAPAVADLDQDGMPEVVVGSGGFSSESGRVTVYRNAGTPEKPQWQAVEMPVIDVGDDAAPALVDVNGDGKPDLVVGNSVGALMLYRNTSAGGRISFSRDAEFFRGMNVGMYAMPAATLQKNRIIIVAGNSMGKLYLLERTQGGSSWQKSALRMEFSNFAAPAFMQKKGEPDANLVVSDGHGEIHYYRNARHDFRHWEAGGAYFASRLLPGPASTPAMADLGSKRGLVTGNINGELKLYEFRASADLLPWVERTDYFKSLKLAGYARGTLVPWQGSQLLITGQQDGYVRAFLNNGSEARPLWKEQKDFFQGVPKSYHASPTVFDIDGDGKWELVVGDVNGSIAAYRMEASGGRPEWRKIEGLFSEISTDRYAAPALVRDNDRIYLFLGRQDGGLQVYAAGNTGTGLPVFVREELLYPLQFQNHSSPSAVMKDGLIELSVGDYNGNLRHFACRNEQIEIP